METAEKLTTQIHHRRPTSIYGDDSLRNTSVVDPSEHVYWHQICHNYAAEKILHVFNEFIDPSQFASKPDYQQEAWLIMFGGKSLDSIADIVNETWLDPDYKLFVARKRFFMLYNYGG